LPLSKGITTIIETNHDPYRFGSFARLSEDQMAALATHLNAPQKAADTILSGRSQPISVDLSGYGPVTIKKYLRGGLIRYINRQTHVKWGPSRPQSEFTMLNRVRKLGVNTPEPVVYITKGKRFYQGWLVTRKLENTESLAELCKTGRSKAETATGELVHQVSLLIDNRILHTDLHPGNVLVDQNGTAYIVDFDKARTDIHNRDKLRYHYKERWRRAIMKYGLPDWLDKLIASDLY